MDASAGLWSMRTETKSRETKLSMFLFSPDIQSKSE